MDNQRLRVLLIEANPGDARLIRELLAEARGSSVRLEHADRLAAGLARVGAATFDALLLDLSLPDIQGLETFTRAHAHAPSVPVVVLSGLADETVAVRAVQAGAQDYLVKGQVDGDAFVRALRYAVEHQRIEAALRESERRF